MEGFGVVIGSIMDDLTSLAVSCWILRLDFGNSDSLLPYYSARAGGFGGVDFYLRMPFLTLESLQGRYMDVWNTTEAAIFDKKLEAANIFLKPQSNLAYLP